MSACVDTDDSLTVSVSTMRCNETTTVTTTVIPKQTTINDVLDTYKQTSTLGKMSSTKMTKPKTTTHATAAATSKTCGKSLGQYSSYLKDNLDVVQQKCSEFHACTAELYKSENLHRILAGENIQLRNICGLLYQNAGGGYRILNNQCSSKERESIKELLGDELLSQLEKSNPGERRWEKLKTCLDNNPGDNTYIDKLCRLKGYSTLPLCNITDVQSTTETFFNNRLKHHHCTCNAVTDLLAPPLRLSPLIGGICGGALMFLLVVIIIVLCVRQRKLKRRLQSSYTRVDHMKSGHVGSRSTVSKCFENSRSPIDESDCFNQGIRDHSQVPNIWRNGPAGQLPRLPERYVPYQLPETTGHNDYDVLPDVACALPEDSGSGTCADQRSPQDRPYVLAEHVAPSPASNRTTRLSGRYEGPLEVEITSEGGYTPLSLNPSLVVRRQSADSEEIDSHNGSHNPSYFELELS